MKKYVNGISTHAPLAGHDKIGVLCPYCVIWISTHAPLAGHDGRPASRALVHIPHFNPRAPCGARLPRLQLCRRAGQISTHAPLAGHDDRSVGVLLGVVVFQPTRPLRGTTENNGTEAKERNNFNPRAPCGARHKTAPTYNRRGKISTHAPLAGHDKWSAAFSLRG